MLDGQYFYNQTMRKAVSVFGSVFNNLKIVRQGGSMERVPLAYAPREKYLERIKNSRDQAGEESVAIKLPRMSFEITNIAYDSNSKLNRMNKRCFPAPNNAIDVVYQSVPYRLSMQLNIMSSTQDDALQVFEQIVPYFSPEYTLSVKDMEGPGSLTDIPIVLNAVSITDDYEGDFVSNRLIIYTLDFDMRVKFIGPVERKTGGIIRVVDTFYYTNIDEDDDSPLLKTVLPYGETGTRVEVDPGDQPPLGPEDTITTTFGFDYLNESPLP